MPGRCRKAAGRDFVPWFLLRALPSAAGHVGIWEQPGWRSGENEETPKLLDQEREIQIFLMRAWLLWSWGFPAAGGILSRRLELNLQDSLDFFGPWRSRFCSLNPTPAQEEFGNCCSRLGKTSQVKPFDSFVCLGAFPGFSTWLKFPGMAQQPAQGCSVMRKRWECGNADAGKAQADVEHLEQPRAVEQLPHPAQPLQQHPWL